MISLETTVAALVRMRWLVIVLLIGMGVAVAMGAVRLEFDPDARSYFSSENPDRVALEELEARHGRYGNIVIMLVAESGDVFTPEILSALARTSARLGEVAGIADARSLVNAAVLPSPGAISPQTASGDAQFLRELWQWDHEPFGAFVSADGTVAAIHLLADPLAGELLDIVRDVRNEVDELRNSDPGITFRMSGDAVMDATFMEAILQDMTWLAPLQGLAICVLLLICLRCFWTTLSLLIVLGLAIAITMGVAGWLGYQLNGVTSATPMILLGLAVATCIHILTSWQQTLRLGHGRITSFAYAIRVNAFPVFLAVFSTVASFLCLNFSDSPPFRELGNLVALGLVVTGILAFTLLPVLVISLPTRPARSRVGAENAMARLGASVVSHHKALAIILLLVSAGTGLGATQLVFDDRFAHYFSDRFEFRGDTDFMEERFTGLTVLGFSLPAGIRDGAGDPVYLASVDRFATWLRAQDDVDRVSDFATQAKGILAADPRIPSDNGLPASFGAGGHLLRAYRDHVGASGTPDRYLSVAGDFTLMSVVLRSVGSRATRDFADRANVWLRDNEPAIAARAAGMPLLGANLSQRNARGMLYGTLVALALVSAILLGALRSLRLGIVSLVPNLIPMLVAYGLWGLFAGEVSFAATVVMAMTFGIVVDDTVHMLAKYNRLRSVSGLPVTKAVPESFRTVGVAVTASTLSIASGFAALAFSGFLVNRDLGILTLLVLFAALGAVLFLLPPLLVLFDRRRSF